MNKTVRMLMLAVFVLSVVVASSSPLMACDPIQLSGYVSGASGPIGGARLNISRTRAFGSNRPWSWMQTVETDVNGYYSVAIPAYCVGWGNVVFIGVKANGYKAQEWISREVMNNGTMVNGLKWWPGEQHQQDFYLETASQPDLAWVGLRNSYYGTTTMETGDYGSLPEGITCTQKYPTPIQWGNAMKNLIPTLTLKNANTKPTMIFVIGEVNTDDKTAGGCMLYMPETDFKLDKMPPEGYDPSQTPPHIPWKGDMSKINFVPAGERTGLNVNDMLTYFDNNNINIILQVEPGYADVRTLMDILMVTYGRRHKSVIGFAIDVEWYQDSNDSDTLEGNVVPDDVAQALEKRLKSLFHLAGYEGCRPSKWQFGLKHYDYLKMPSVYRGDIVFIDDTQGEPNRETELNGWASHFVPNDVIFQQGYKIDATTADGWGYNPNNLNKRTEVTAYGNRLIPSALAGQKTGFLWVDFTMRAVFPEITVECVQQIPPWTTGVWYQVGDQVTYKGSQYQCTYYHLAQRGWEPDNPTMWAVWKKL